MPRIKVCGLRDPGNIRGIASLSPDYLGFIFHPGSVRFIGKDPDRELFSGIPGKIKKTGVFVDEKIEKVKATVSRYRLEAVQLHGSESADYCNQIKSQNLIIIKAFRIGPGFDFNNTLLYNYSCDFFLFDTLSEFPGGSGKKFRWNLLKKQRIEKPFFLSGGIGIEDIEVIRNFDHKMLYAIDINSRFEVAPAIKNVELVRSFIENINNPIL